MRRLAVIVSGNGSNLGALIDATNTGRIDGQIVGVFANRRSAFGLVRAARAGLHHEHVPARPFRDASDPRSAYDAHLADRVAAVRPDWVVLAGFMRIVTPVFLQRFPRRVVNLHPALPGAFDGLDSIRRAWDAAQEGRVDHTGVMVHEVDESVDGGPVLGTTVVPIPPGMSLEELEHAVHAAEHQLLVEVLAGLCAD